MLDAHALRGVTFRSGVRFLLTAKRSKRVRSAERSESKSIRDTYALLSSPFRV